MTGMLKIPKYSMGIGDRFGKQGEAQLNAMIAARDAGIEISPVWNKSHREHSIIHTKPSDVRTEADAAVKALGWDAPYFVDADHINMNNVDEFIAVSDFFTLDVANAIGKPASESDVNAFVEKHKTLCGEIPLSGVSESLQITPELIRSVAEQYLFAVQEAGRLCRHIAETRPADSFVTEVSMDETPAPQTPIEMLVILAAIADEKIPAQTIAPRFSGRFNKGVDYVGDVDAFAREFRADIAVVRFAVAEFGLPSTLKLSVHSGSDKFAIYPHIAQALSEFDAGIHIKTAGTTWLEELIGLAEAGENALDIARKVYRNALGRFDELCGPYADVIDIDADQLPQADEVDNWNGAKYAAVLRHDQSCPDYNPNFRQLLHVGYKIAAELGEEYLDALQEHKNIIGAGVTENLYERHMQRLFPQIKE